MAFYNRLLLVLDPIKLVFLIPNSKHRCESAPKADYSVASVSKHLLDFIDLIKFKRSEARLHLVRHRSSLWKIAISYRQTICNLRGESIPSLWGCLLPAGRRNKLAKRVQ